MRAGYQYNSIYHRHFPLLFRGEKDGECHLHQDSAYKCKRKSLWSRVSSKRLIKSQAALARSGQRAAEQESAQRQRTQSRTKTLKMKPRASVENTPIAELNSPGGSEASEKSAVNKLKAVLMKKKHIQFKPRTPEREAARSPLRGPRPKAEDSFKILKKRPTLLKRNFESASRGGQQQLMQSFDDSSLFNLPNYGRN